MLTPFEFFLLYRQWVAYGWSLGRFRARWHVRKERLNRAWVRPSDGDSQVDWEEDHEPDLTVVMRWSAASREGLLGTVIPHVATESIRSARRRPGLGFISICAAVGRLDCQYFPLFEGQRHLAVSMLRPPEGRFLVCHVSSFGQLTWDQGKQSSPRASS